MRKRLRRPCTDCGALTRCATLICHECRTGVSELELTGGRWVGVGGIMRWQPDGRAA